MVEWLNGNCPRSAFISPRLLAWEGWQAVKASLVEWLIRILPLEDLMEKRLKLSVLF
ncbi:hypothetical protein [Caldithrix abyssi]|uniref:Uncharacterized protein n=1 Tax=Caldithrix abyssi DSM 13497 TaxID=880073 RepID=A0A1J1C7B6_CALAY|nr:hypothetical protein [Caldithrix abyssi]APF17882.1 hypothetical protein Cabys_1133 [Caldithrix abyssi DSM 13497]